MEQWPFISSAQTAEVSINSLTASWKGPVNSLQTLDETFLAFNLNSTEAQETKINYYLQFSPCKGTLQTVFCLTGKKTYHLKQVLKTNLKVQDFRKTSAPDSILTGSPILIIYSIYSVQIFYIGFLCQNSLFLKEACHHRSMLCWFPILVFPVYASQYIWLAKFA